MTHRKALAGVALLIVTIGSATEGHAQRKRTARIEQQDAPRAVPKHVVIPIVPTAWLYVRTLAHAGLPQGIGLDGARDRRVVSFRLPSPAPITQARLTFKLQFSGGLLPQSNVQIFANGTRLIAVSRADADVHGMASVEIPVPANLLTGPFLAVSLQSALATTADRCLDDRLGLPHVQVEPESNFSYTLAVDAVNTVQTAIAVLPDTVTLSLPARRLQPFEFWSVYTAAIELNRLGYTLQYTQLPQPGDVTIGTQAEIAAATSVTAPPATTGRVSLFRYGTPAGPRVGVAIIADSSAAGASMFGQSWMALGGSDSLLVRRARGDALAAGVDPTFADLRMQDLQQDIGADATWRLGLDIRELPAGRVPIRLDLRVVTAPNTNRRQLVAYVFWNGTLIRSADISGDGLPQNLGVTVPAELVSTRNEIRVTMQRHLDAPEGCQLADASVPAQILPSSRVLTGSASAAAESFDGVVARLGASSSLYLPADALDHPDHYLPMLVGIARAFWTAPRIPRPVFYGPNPPALPSGAFVLVGDLPNAPIESPLTVRTGRLVIHQKETRDTILDISDMGAWNVAEVVKWNGQFGVQLLPAAAAGPMPSYPEAYGSANLLLAHGDSTLFPLNTTGVHGTLVINEGPTVMDKFLRDWKLWAIFAAGLTIVPIGLGVRSVMRRTPRRDIRDTRRFPTPPRPPSVPGI